MRVASQVTAHQSLFFPWDLATEMPVKEALLTTDTTLPTLFLYPLMLSRPDLFCVNLVTLCLSKLSEDSYFLVIRYSAIENLYLIQTIDSLHFFSFLK